MAEAAWWLEEVEPTDAPHVKARKEAFLRSVCAFPLNVEGTELCCAPRIYGELYCDDHVYRVHKRLNIAGELMPDDPRAPWLQKA